MKSSIFLGNNVGSIAYKYFGTFKVYGLYNKRKMHSIISNLFDKISPMNEMNYNIEDYKNPLFQHVHIQFNTTDDDILHHGIVEYIKPEKIIEGIAEKLVKCKKDIRSINTGVEYEDKFLKTKYINYIGRKKELYIEHIINNVNASIYTHKQSDYGINNGYLKRQF
jgi:hypothetical protein